MRTGLYIHIPFCVRKCNYCDFYSLGCATEKNMREYTDALITHIRREAPSLKDRVFDTVFIGGGTPSLLDNECIVLLFDCIRAELNISSDAEISIEANPGTVTEDMARLYHVLGINRVSIGLQSVNDRELKILGRIHDLDKFKSSYEILRKAGIENINIDIMYSLPDQTLPDFIKTLDTVCDFSPDHISAYCLKIEENTHFYKIRDQLVLPSEDEQYEMYMTLCAYLERYGYSQYEISNFARMDHLCRHNLKYWLNEDYVGFGPSAHSLIDGVRYWYSDNIGEYIDSINNGGTPEKMLEYEHSPDENEKIDEYVMLRMRLSRGVDADEFLSRFGIEFESRYKRIDKYIKSGHIVKRGNSFSFTEKGFFVSNYILSDILEFI